MSAARKIAVAALALAACATPPKPHELETFENLRAQQQLEAARKRSPDLVRGSDELLQKAQKEWESGKLDDSRRDALMGAIKLKTALALVEQDQARARAQAADAQFAKVNEEYGRVAKELQQANEQIALYQKLAETKNASAAEKQKMMAEMQVQQQKLADEQARASARDKVAAAELALKTADTVDAAANAKTEYASANDTLERAQAELKKGDWAAAQTSADLAKSKAQQAYEVARPIYETHQQTQSSKARDEALGRDAAALPQVTVRLERRGDVQRLVLPLRDLFVKRSTALAAGQDARLDAIATLLKKYPTYPVQVIGHTDNRGKHDELVALSLARAQSVFAALTARGVEARRMLVSGQGPDEPAADNKSTGGRAQNNRVEVVFLYQ
jgi:outer membrane protein OmpA-like peptidoglycan-associated protein